MKHKIKPNEEVSICEVCGCAEGSLATECPGYWCSYEIGSFISKKIIDFKNGQWVKRTEVIDVDTLIDCLP